jgi:membrane protease YdiL (CAAX protease family)
MTFGPGMRAMLLVALCFSGIGIYEFLEFLAKRNELTWFPPSMDAGMPAYYVWISRIIFSVLVFAAPAIVYANVFPAERFKFFRLEKKVPVAQLLLGTVAMIFLFPVLYQVGAWIDNSITDPQILKYKEEVNKISAWAVQMPNVGSLLFCLFANAFIPAVCEELFFRGALQQVLSERARVKLAPVVITSLIFAFLHFDPLFFPSAFLGGLILGLAFYWTRSLRLCIAIHFFFNGTSLIIEYLAQHNPAVRAWEPGMVEFSIGVVVCSAMMFLLWKKTRGAKGISR